MVILKGKLITLRQFKFKDIKAIYRLESNPKVNKPTNGLPWPYKYRDALRSYRKYTKKDKKAYRFAIVWNQTKQVIGCTGLIGLSYKNKIGESSTWILPEFWGTGIYLESRKLLFNFGFKKLKLHKIKIATCSSNIRCQKAIKKTGAKKEGLSRQCVYKCGKFRDVTFYGLLKKEWRPSKLK